MDTDIIIIIVVVAIGLVITLLLAYVQSVSNKKLNNKIIDYYSERGIKVIEINKLTFLEKLRYKRFLLARFPTYEDSTLTSIKYYRVVTLTDKQNDESTKFISIELNYEDIEKIEEFDSYDF
jgi:hypothetical protein